MFYGLLEPTRDGCYSSSLSGRGSSGRTAFATGRHPAPCGSVRLGNQLHVSLAVQWTASSGASAMLPRLASSPSSRSIAAAPA